MKIPLPVRQRGGLGLIDWLDELYWFARGSQPLRSESIDVHETPEGTQLIARATGLSASASPLQPGGFKCAAVQVEGEVKIRVYYGTILGVAPQGFTLGDVYPYLLDPVGGAGVVALGVTVDDDGYLDSNSSSRSVACHAAQPENTDDTFYLQLGSYGIDLAGALQVTPGGQGNGVGDQWFELCGGIGGDPNFGPA